MKEFLIWLLEAKQLYIYMCVCVCVCVSVCVCVYMCVCVCVSICTYIYIYMVIYKALCFDVAQGRMNGAPNETQTHSCRFASLAC